MDGKFPDCLDFFGELTEQVWPDNGHHVRAHEKNSGNAVRRLGTTTQSIFLCPIRSQHSLDSSEMIRWESAPRTLPHTPENFCRAFSPDPTDCPWVSEDGKVSEMLLNLGTDYMMNFRAVCRAAVSATSLLPVSQKLGKWNVVLYLSQKRIQGTKKYIFVYLRKVIIDIHFEHWL